MPRGGKRSGAGRPKGTGKFGEPTQAVRLPASKIAAILEFVRKKALAFPVYVSGLKTQRSPDTNFDLMNRIEANPDSLVYVQVNGESMSGAKIGIGDMLVVDKSQEPREGDLVAAVVSGEDLVRRYVRKGKIIELKAENAKFPAIKIDDATSLEIVGVVKHVFRSL